MPNVVAATTPPTGIEGRKVVRFMPATSPFSWRRVFAALGCNRSHSWDLLEKILLKPDVVHETAEEWIDVNANVENEESLRIDLGDPIRASETELKDAATLIGELRNPIGHPSESNSATSLNH